MADREGKGQIQINFVSYEVLRKLNDIGPEIARQICRARVIVSNKLIKEKWSLYNIWDKKNLVRHFDFSPNPSDEPLESPDFEYKRTKQDREQAQRADENGYESDDVSKIGKIKSEHHREHDRHAHGRDGMPNIPKQLYFDGSENFQTFSEPSRNHREHDKYAHGRDRTPNIPKQLYFDGSENFKTFSEPIRNHREYDKYAHGRDRTPNIPKQLYFDGSENFQTFWHKFRAFTDYNTFSDETAMFCLGMALRGSASRFYEQLRLHGRVNTLTEALDQLKRRFGNNQGIYAGKLAFQNARQKPKESDEDFAERLSELVHNAYPNGEWDQMEEEVAMKFMAGLNDPKARAFLSEHCTIATMEEMTDKLQRFYVSKQLARPDRGKWNRINEYNEDFSEEDSESEQEEWNSARKVTIKDARGKYKEDKVRLDNFERKMEKLEEKENKNASKIDNIEKSVTGLTEMMIKMQEQLSRMERNFSKDGGEGSLGETQANSLHLNKKGSY